jgi:hypothetical protein
MTHRFASTLLAVLIMMAVAFPSRVTADEHDSKVTADQLQARLMAFADTYMNVLAEEYARLDALGLTAEQRLYLHTRMLLSATAAITIASGPDVAQNLLDMITMVVLSRMIIDEPQLQKEAGVDLTITRAVAADFENRIWNIAADVASEEHIEAVRSHIADYRRQHPHQSAAYFVRFDEGAALRGATRLTEKVRQSGLLSSVSDAGQAVDEARQTAERALFIGNRMPILVGWQVENLFYKLAVSPEYRSMSATPEALKTSIDDLSGSIEAIPGLVTSEREAVLAALDDRQGALTGTVGELRGALDDAIAVLPQVEVLAATVERTVASGREASVALNQMLATSERLINHIEKDGDRFDRFVEIIPELGVAATKLERVMGSVDEMLGHDSSFGSLMDRIFWRLVMLIIVFFAAMLVAGVLYKIAAQRWAVQSVRS